MAHKCGEWLHTNCSVTGSQCRIVGHRIRNGPNIFFRDVVPFRYFLKSNVYATKEDVSYAVGKDKGVDKFYPSVLDLRDDWPGRKSIGDCI